MKKIQEFYSKKRLLSLGIFGVLLFGSVLCIGWMYLDTHFSKDADRALFGDKFGFINALFSGLAFFVIFLSLIFQSEELKSQRTELSLTRNIHAKQNFESLFFFIIKQLETSLQSVEGSFHMEQPLNDNANSYDEMYRLPLAGNTYFDYLYKEFRVFHYRLIELDEVLIPSNIFNILNHDDYDINIEAIREHYKTHYKEDYSQQLIAHVYNYRQDEVLIFFRNLLQSILFISNEYVDLIQGIKSEDKAELDKRFRVYCNILRNLVSVETRIMFLYVMRRNGNFFEKNMITQYIFRDIPSEMYLDDQHYKDRFKKYKKSTNQ